MDPKDKEKLPLLKLPYTPLSRVFEIMEVHEVFLLSTCSGKSKEKIKKSKLKERFSGVQYVSEPYFTGFISMASCGTFRNAVEWKIVETSAEKKKFSTIRFDGLEVKYRLKNHHKPEKLPILCIEDNKEYSELLPLKLFNYTTDLFQTTEIKEIRLKRTNFSDFPNTVSRVQNALIDTYCQYANPLVFEKFFQAIHVENCFVSEQSIRGPMAEDTPIIRIPNVFLESATWILPYHLMNFKGRHAVFENTKLIKQSDLNQFVKYWVDGGFENLETMIISMEGNMRYQEILSDVEKLLYERDRHAPKFVYKAAFRWFFQKDFDFLDCAHAYDILRTTDGTCASMRISSETKSGIARYYFLFYVWHDKFPSEEEHQNDEPGYEFL